MNLVIRWIKDNKIVTTLVFLLTFEMFLFTCNFSFSVLLLGVNKRLFRKQYFRIIFVFLTLIIGINNLIIIRQIITT